TMVCATLQSELPFGYCPITDQIIFELFMHSRVRDLSPPWLLFIAENGYGKRVPLNAFRQSSFNRVGLRGYKLPEDCRLAAVFVVGEPTDDDASEEQVVLVSHGGTVNRIKVKDISIQGRGGSNSDEAGACWEDPVSFTDISSSRGRDLGRL
uniref:Uncharacterized protein n=1 Tax=Aegilops tauschii subsp. strangulata TaxID=200361 RepID=A0A453M7Q2_AEGTS